MAQRPLASQARCLPEGILALWALFCTSAACSSSSPCAATARPIQSRRPSRSPPRGVSSLPSFVVASFRAQTQAPCSTTQAAWQLQQKAAYQRAPGLAMASKRQSLPRTAMRHTRNMPRRSAHTKLSAAARCLRGGGSSVADASQSARTAGGKARRACAESEVGS